MSDRRPSKREDKYVYDLELTRKYQVALVASFAHVNLAAQYYLDFSQSTYPTAYRRRQFFEDYVARHESTISAVAQVIDQDIHHFWKSSLEAIRKSHTDRVAQYAKFFRNKKRLRQYEHILHGKKGSAHLEMMSKDLDETIKKLPTSHFKAPEDVRNWQALSERCVPVINDTFGLHSDVYKLIEDVKERQRLLRSDKVKILGGFSSAAVSAGKLFLTGVPS